MGLALVLFQNVSMRAVAMRQRCMVMAMGMGSSEVLPAPDALPRLHPVVSDVDVLVIVHERVMRVLDG
jgi:hypothetical protein